MSLTFLLQQLASLDEEIHLVERTYTDKNSLRYDQKYYMP